MCGTTEFNYWAYATAPHYWQLCSVVWIFGVWHFFFECGSCRNERPVRWYLWQAVNLVFLSPAMSGWRADVTIILRNDLPRWKLSSHLKNYFTLASFHTKNLLSVVLNTSCFSSTYVGGRKLGTTLMDERETCRWSFNYSVYALVISMATVSGKSPVQLFKNESLTSSETCLHDFCGRWQRAHSSQNGVQ